MLVGSLPACGRIGFDLIDLAPSGALREFDAGSQSADATTDGTLTTGDGRANGLDATRDGERIPIDGARGGSNTDAPVDSARDAASDSGPRGPNDGSKPTDTGVPDSGSVACANAKTWFFGFDSDPTLADTDNDGVLDWVVRNGTPFPVSELQAGVWHSQTNSVLDSRPMDAFSSRTVVDVRMQSLSVPSTGRGAVFWVNLNEDQAAFSAVFVSLALQAGGGQTLTLMGKSGPGTEVALASFPSLAESTIDVHLDIDPVALTVAVGVNGVLRGSYAIPQTGAPNADHFATLLAWDGVAGFDSIRIQRCPP